MVPPMSTYEEWQQAADLRFMNFYDDTLRQLRTDVGLAIAEFDGRGVLHSSMYYSRRHELVAAAAKKLSLTRLEMDLSALLQRGLPIKVNEDKLKSHQYNLLREQFWMNYVLAEFKKTGRPESVAEYETHIWNELDNLYHQAERLIAAAALDDASPKPQIQQPIIQNTYINNGGQQNVAATENASVYATQVNNYSDMEQLATKLAELLKASNLPTDVKEEAVDLAETVAEQAKSGQPRKGVLKSLSNVLQAVNDTNGLLKSGKDLYDTASQMGELIKPFIS
jgi:hypothetical protein